MSSKRSTDLTSWVSSPKPNPTARVRLFCFPYSGAGASLYYAWGDILPAFIEVFPVQLPGRGTRVAEPAFTQLEPLVQATMDALVDFMDKPFAFFGHSMGALVGYELSRKLKIDHGVQPSYLFVSGHNAPHIPDPEAPIHNLPQDQFIAKIRNMNGTPDEVLQNEELRDLVIPILRADFSVCETYVHQPGQPLDCPICACGGLQDPYLSREGLQAWQDHTTAYFSVRQFPGDHFYLNNSKMYLLQVIAQELNRVL